MSIYIELTEICTVQVDLDKIYFTKEQAGLCEIPIVQNSILTKLTPVLNL